MDWNWQEVFPTGYEYFTYLGHYSRWIEEEQRREMWPETIKRYMDFMKVHLKERCDYTIPNDLYQEVYNAIYYLQVMPSMRCLWTAGDALRRDEAAGFNCFAGHQEILTDKGNRKIGDLADQYVKVLAGDGEWSEVQVKSYSHQEVMKITLRPGNRTKVRHTIYVTKDHKWWTYNRGEVTDLMCGDQIPSSTVDTPQDIDLASYIRGFGFGDGTLDSRGRARVRLCGEKNNLLPIFEAFGNCSIMSPPSHNGDALVVFHKGFFENWKEIPEVEDIDPYSWLYGYIDADASAGPSSINLTSQNNDGIEFVKQIAPLAGFVVTGHNQLTSPTNYGERKAPLQRLSLAEKTIFHVEAIEYNQTETEEVFCVEEPRTHYFTLANGILTGNCAFRPVDHPHAFDETMYLLMVGTGVGFSVEGRFTSMLPVVSPEVEEATDTVIQVADSRIGWARAYRELIAMLFNGVYPKWDLSRIRPAGSRLKVFGGRASGPEPLEDLFLFTTNIFRQHVGRKLSNLACHDLMTKVGECVVAGGVRRSALISLSDLSDYDMRNAKTGTWWEDYEHRRLANNSAVYFERPSVGQFLREWESLYNSKSGERGIFNLGGIRAREERRGVRDFNLIEGCNPCSEINLLAREFCNLAEIIVRPGDSKKVLIAKCRIAAILGTWQSTLTDFRYIGSKWRRNCEEERLLGVSMTGIFDNPRLCNLNHATQLTAELEGLREVARLINEDTAKELGINASKAITCIKPSGTVSQLCNTASGIHPRYSRYYIRRQQMANMDPITTAMVAAGVPNDPYINKPDHDTSFAFPVEAPKGCKTVEDVSPIEHLELWRIYQNAWCDHKPSATIYLREQDWLPVASWVYQNFDDISGVSFYPYDENEYQQPVYQEVSKGKFQEAVAQMPKEIDFHGLLKEYEKDDETTGAREYACVGGACELT